MSDRRRRNYSEEYKEHACKMVVYSARPIRHVARELGIGEQMLGRWVKDWRVANNQPVPLVKPDPAMTPALADAPPVDPGPGLAVDVATAIDGMAWLEDSDQAVVALAKKYAGQIDAGIQRGGKDATSAMYLGPHLLNALRDLGGTPAHRKAMKLGGGGNKGGRLALLRSTRGGGDDDTGGEEQAG